ncbi:MAG: DMT family transporter, partial [Clostridiales bacterium]|nr:DMT family transporter [Clostridiales bacterium]
QFSYLNAISYSNSASATVFQNSGIIVVMFITCILGRRFPRTKEVLAAVLALSGVFLLSTHGRLDGLVISQNAFLWGMLAALAWVSYTLLPGKLLERWGTPVVNGVGMLIGGIVMGAGIKVWQQSWTFEWNIVLAIAVMIIFGTVVAFTFYLQGVADIGPVKASMLACVEPLVATILSAVWLKTEFAWIDIFGFVLIIGGCMLVSMNRETESV